MFTKKDKIIGISIGVIIILSFLFFQKPDLINLDLPSCGDKKELFSYYPIDLNDIKRVTPQGEFSGMGGHVFPVKHVYAFDKYSPSSGYSIDVNRPKTEMVAPADMIITSITKYWDKNRGDEYYIDFSLCQEVSGSFFHMSDLSPKLMQEFEKHKEQNKKDTQDRGFTVFETINSKVEVEVKAGEFIGVASIKSSQMFDFNLIDTRVPELNFINKERFRKHRAFDLLHEVCPYDYFTSEIKSILYSKISGYFNKDKKRTVQPLCGEYMQDIPNTAQGVWFRKGTANGETGNPQDIIEREALHMALGHEAFDPQRPIISLGLESIKELEPLVYFIKPSSEGLVNRDWKDITSDGKIYCSELTFDDNNHSPAGESIILQMPTTTTLKIEKLGSPTCGNGPWEFKDKATEFER